MLDHLTRSTHCTGFMELEIMNDIPDWVFILCIVAGFGGCLQGFHNLQESVNETNRLLIVLLTEIRRGIDRP